MIHSILWQIFNGTEWIYSRKWNYISHTYLNSSSIFNRIPQNEGHQIYSDIFNKFHLIERFSSHTLHRMQVDVTPKEMDIEIEWIAKGHTQKGDMWTFFLQSMAYYNANILVWIECTIGGVSKLWIRVGGINNEKYWKDCVRQWKWCEGLVPFFTCLGNCR